MHGVITNYDIKVISEEALQLESKYRKRIIIRLSRNDASELELFSGNDKLYDGIVMISWKMM